MVVGLVGKGGKTFGSGSEKLITNGTVRRFQGLFAALVGDGSSIGCLAAVQMIPERAAEYLELHVIRREGGCIYFGLSEDLFELWLILKIMFDNGIPDNGRQGGKIVCIHGDVQTFTVSVIVEIEHERLF
jgi:hypothetical protein